MTLDISNKLLRCDARGCNAATPVPIEFRQFYDDNISELRSESSAAGWVFVSSGRHDKHFCPECAERCIRPHKR